MKCQAETITELRNEVEQLKTLPQYVPTWVQSQQANPWILGAFPTFPALDITQRRGATPHWGSWVYPDADGPPRVPAAAHTDCDTLPRPRADSFTPPLHQSPKGRPKNRAYVEIPLARHKRHAPHASSVQPSSAGRESRAYNTTPRVLRRVTFILNPKTEDPDDALGDAQLTHPGSVHKRGEDVAPATRSGRPWHVSHPSPQRKQVVEESDEDEQESNVSNDVEHCREEPEDEGDEHLYGLQVRHVPFGH